MPALAPQLTSLIMPAEPGPAGPSLLSRLTHALDEMRRRQLEREIGRFIEREGGRISDDLERRIERHFV